MNELQNKTQIEKERKISRKSQKKDYYDLNRERILSYSKEYYRKNKDIRWRYDKEKSAKYYRENAQLIKERNILRKIENG